MGILWELEFPLFSTPIPMEIAWESHRNPIGIGIPIPMHTSNC